VTNLGACLWPGNEMTVIFVGLRKVAAAQKFWFRKSQVKIMLVIFFNWQGIVHKEFVPEGQTANSEFYREGMDGLLNRLWCNRLDKAQWGNWFVLHDTYITTVIKQLLAKKRFTFLYHPPLPDLAPADYFLFFKVKSKFKATVLTAFQMSRTMW
jgi:hypothetical protein